MAFTLDPQVAAVMQSLSELASGMSGPSVGDVATRRLTMEAGQVFMESRRVMPSDVTMTDFEAHASDGATVALRWYVKNGARHRGLRRSLPARWRDDSGEHWALRRGAGSLRIEQRCADAVGRVSIRPRIPWSYACGRQLRWLVDHSPELGTDPLRIAVMGDSAGGGIAAGLALLARDRGGPEIAQQILIYPMLDDRTTVPDPELVPFAGWTYEDNLTGWAALLGDGVGGADVSPYAAPARMTAAVGLPSVYLEVGELDIFRNEGMEFARRTAEAGVSTELHVHPGVPHGWDVVAPGADVSNRSMADRIRRLQGV